MNRSLLLLSTVVLVMFCAFTSNAQIPNAGFENWSPTPPPPPPAIITPDGWWTNNMPAPPFSSVPVTKSGTAHSGNSSVRGEVVSSLGAPGNAPMIMAGINVGGDVDGFAWTQRSASITGYYQFFPVSGSGDRISILGSLMKGGMKGNGVAVVGGYVTTAASSWTQFSVPFTYLTANVPDWASLSFFISGPAGKDATNGSYFLLDDLAFSGTASAVSELAGVPQSFALEQNYPNPFNPSTSIRFSVAQPGHVSLKVYNVLGVEVASLVNQQKDAGTFTVNWNASGLPSGMYLYRLSIASDKGQVFDQSKKLVLLK
jgi:hypothetical protein